MQIITGEKEKDLRKFQLVTGKKLERGGQKKKILRAGNTTTLFRNHQ